MYLGATTSGNPLTAGKPGVSQTLAEDVTPVNPTTANASQPSVATLTAPSSACTCVPWWCYAAVGTSAVTVPLAAWFAAKYMNKKKGRHR